MKNFEKTHNTKQDDSEYLEIVFNVSKLDMEGKLLGQLVTIKEIIMKSFVKVIAIACLMSFVTIQAHAQEEKKLVTGNSFNVMIPQGDLANTYSHGFGVYSNIDYNFNKFLAARFDFGWNDLSGDETSYVDPDGTIHVNHPNMSVWEFTGGLRAKVSIFYLEARGGYFTGLKSWGYVPAAGIRIGKFDIQGNYTIAGDNQWVSARLAYFWEK